MTRHRRSHLYQRVGAPDVVIASSRENTRCVGGSCACAVHCRYMEVPFITATDINSTVLRIYNQNAAPTEKSTQGLVVTGAKLVHGYSTLLFFVAFRVIARVVYFVDWRCSNRPRKFFAWTADAERLSFQLARVHSYVDGV